MASAAMTTPQLIRMNSREVLNILRTQVIGRWMCIPPRSLLRVDILVHFLEKIF